MQDRISLRPMTGDTRLGPSTDFFASFRTGAGKHLRSTNRDNQWESKTSKKPEERIRYSKLFLMKIRQEFLDLPAAANTQISCFGSAEESWTKPEQDLATTEAEEKLSHQALSTDADWRNRQQNNDKSFVTEQTALPVPLSTEGAKVTQLQKAEELGREAYRPRAAQIITDDEKNVRQVNGILNKLTPNNFDRLAAQVAELVINAEVLRKTISLVFEKAVAEPTFCALYAKLCEHLSSETRDFPPIEGEIQKLTFRRILLNTCQDEFEGVETARQGLESLEEPMEREIAEKKVKNRTLGNMRLISELFNKGLVAVCEVLTLAGKKLSQSQKYETNLSAYLARLERFTKIKALASRICFLIRDVLDMQRNDWIPRREKFTAKKIEEIHAEAENELGIQIRMALPKTAAPISTTVDDSELFPTPQRFNREGEWKAVADRLNKGPVKQVEQPQPQPAPAPAATSLKKKELKSPEDREKYAESMFHEYLSSMDKKEAHLCAEEICSASEEHSIELVSLGLKVMFDCVANRDHTLLMELLVWFCASAGVYTKEGFILGLKMMTDQLDDLALDIPKSPELCGNLLGKAIVEKVAEIEVLPSLCRSIMGAEARRPFAVAVFDSIKAAGIDVVQSCQEGGLRVKEFLKAKEGFDVPDLESVEAFLKKRGYSRLPI